MAESTWSGGQITPFDWASFSPSGLPVGVGTFTSPPCPTVACVSACAQAAACAWSALGAVGCGVAGGDWAKAADEKRAMQMPRARESMAAILGLLWTNGQRRARFRI